MKKVGILTWHYGANYGAKAQAYALQKTIQFLGFEAQIIDYRIKNYYLKNLKINLKLSSKIKKFKFTPVMDIQIVRKLNVLERFNSKYNLTNRITRISEINDLGLDSIVLGSDAIFNIYHPFFNEVYYGVGLKNSKLITYAPSCENLPPETNLGMRVKESLNSVHKISVRDVNTELLIENNVHKSPVITLDPTLLYEFSDINAKIPEFGCKYILLYAFSDWAVYSEQIKEYAKQHSLKIISLGYYYNWVDLNYVQCSFEEWVSAFRCAELVVTDSFHGTVFSIKNDKEFIIIGRSDKNSKITSLLNDCNIQRSFYNGGEPIDEYLSRPIDYTRVKKKIEEKVIASIEYLKNALLY